MLSTKVSDNIWSGKIWEIDWIILSLATVFFKKIMGNADTKLHFRKAVIQLTTKTQPVDVADDVSNSMGYGR